jgi:hypothetical protein
MNDFFPATLITNGHFYGFQYNPANIVPNYDAFPLIYCVGPSLTNINNIRGLNLHHIPRTQRFEFLKKMEKEYNFTNKSRCVLTDDQLNRLLPGVIVAIREYSRKRMCQVFEIYNKSMPKFIYSDGNIRQCIPDREVIDYFAKSNNAHV